MEHLNHISINIRGLNSDEKRNKLYEWLKIIKCDIAFIQETHFIECKKDIYKRNWDGIIANGYSDSQFSRGVSILFKETLDVKIIDKHASNDGRIIVLNVMIQEKYITYINVYAPNDEKTKHVFFDKLKRYVIQHAMYKENMYIFGDFNCNFEKDTDRCKGKLRSILAYFDLIDVWYNQHTDLKGFTWCDNNDVPKSRIDFIFTNETNVNNIKSIIVRRVPGTQNNGIRMTDHRYLKLKVNIHNLKRGSGYWKFNVKYLADSEYKNGVKSIIEHLEDDNPIAKWETFKLKVKEFSIRYAKSSIFEDRQKIHRLEKELDNIETGNSGDINMNRKKEIERELDTLFENKSKGAQIRSKAKYIVDGEKNTNFFLSLEKKHQANNTIRELKTSRGNKIIENGDILNAMCDFYSNLYETKNIDDADIDDYLNSTNTPILSDELKNVCEQNPSQTEIRNAVFGMKSGKSPGLDGLNSEFYQCFWDDIEHLFTSVINCIYEQQEMSFSQRLAIITLIFKKGDRTSLTNYRPLSLTNTDYKIIAFVLARRLPTVIDKLIGKQQSAYIKGRNISQNARLILDIFDFCESSDTDGLLLLLDFEKAFDSVEWNFLFKTLEKFNFGPNFISWIKILYTNPIFRIKNNGWVSKTCKMNRGIRQGCPISAMLYLFVAEILALKIRENDDIPGIKINCSTEMKTIQHADDLTLSLKNEKALDKSLKVIHSFCNITGTKVNIAKTQCILLGGLKNRHAKLFGIDITNRAVKCLGIHIGHDKDECYKKNWINTVNDMEKLFETWKKRKLTLFGKTCIVNTLAVSKFIYKASILPYPEEALINKVKSDIFNFIWNKTDRIKRNTLIGDVKSGGIGVIDIETKLKSLKAVWVSKLFKDKGIMYEIVKGYLNKINILPEYLVKQMKRTPTTLES